MNGSVVVKNEFLPVLMRLCYLAPFLVLNKRMSICSNLEPNRELCQGKQACRKCCAAVYSYLYIFASLHYVSHGWQMGPVYRSPRANHATTGVLAERHSYPVTPT